MKPNPTNAAQPQPKWGKLPACPLPEWTTKMGVPLWRADRRIYAFPSDLTLKGSKLIACLGCLLLAGCASNQLQVISRSRTQTVAKVDRNFFLRGPASDTALLAQPLPKDQQGQEFCVRWGHPAVESVRIEYRQVSAPNKVHEQVSPPGHHHSHVFFIRAEQGDNVTAWRVTLLRGSETIAENKSALW